MALHCIEIQGNVLTGEIFEKIRNGEISYQAAKDFGLDGHTRVRDEIGVAWSLAKAHWLAFRQRLEMLAPEDTGTSLTRNTWMAPLLNELGYELKYNSSAYQVHGKPYAISHHVPGRDEFPVHIMGYHDNLDKRRITGGPRLSPHALLQEYLNHTDHVYGLVTNGRQLRLLRDANRLAKLAYVQFDLEKMLEEDQYAEFALMYRVLHASRMPESRDKIKSAIIDIYHDEGIQSGARIREKLSEAVEDSIQELANGFLKHPANAEFRAACKSEEVTVEAFYRQLLRLIYRLLFLLVTEDRNLIYPPGTRSDDPRKRDIYFKYYSIGRLRQLAMELLYVDRHKSDLWDGLKATFLLFEKSEAGSALGIAALGSGIFAPNVLDLLTPLSLDNQALLYVVKRLTHFENKNNQQARVNYGDLDVEEFGSVYEGLLELRPVINRVQEAVEFKLLGGGMDQKTSGSYYTSHDLVAQLIKTSLNPLMEERLKGKGSKEDKEAALLSIKVCDPACGSGHFLLAAARSLGFRLAQVRTDEESPGAEPVRAAMRDVIQHCIYGVDQNPAAVELCKVALWIEGHSTGKPLGFLDHHIRPGNSLIGIDHLDRLKEGIPDGAFKETTGDDKKIAGQIKKRNAAFRKSGQMDLFLGSLDFDAQTHRFAESVYEIEAIQGNTVDEVERQRALYEQSRQGEAWKQEREACNLFTFAFFQTYHPERPLQAYVDSETLARYLKRDGSVKEELIELANETAVQVGFFHWPLEFPEIAEKGGFDLFLANPPWERIKLQEKEFFSGLDAAISNAPNATARKRLISRLPQSNPVLFEKYMLALHVSEASSKFIRDSERYPLTGRGDINTYSIFSELIKNGINETGRAGFIVPTGIATDDTNKYFFADLVESGRLISLFDFENRKAIFPTVHRSFKFSLITLGAPLANRESTFGFFMHDVLDLNDDRRVFTLSKEDFLNINPNTKTTPIFRTRQDAELTAKIYSRVPVLKNEEKNQNPWGVKFMTMFHMSSDSHLFKTRDQLADAGYVLKGNRFVKDGDVWLPLYEGKMCNFFNHRAANVLIIPENLHRSAQADYTSDKNLEDCQFLVEPQYWVQLSTLEEISQNDQKFHIGFKSVTSPTNERTFIPSFIPFSGVGNSFPIILMGQSWISNLLLFSNLSSVVFDFFVKQKIGGVNLNFFFVNQFCVIPPKAYLYSEPISQIANAVELVYTSWDIKHLADEVWKSADEVLRVSINGLWNENKRQTGGHTWEIPEWADAYPEIDWEPDKNGGCPLPPFKWDEERRAYLKAELDAYFALLYGLERDELRYILDPQDVYGEDFPGETFRVLKEKEIRKYGEYRTRRLVLEAYDRLRPDWDMEAHLAKLKAIWEECQVDLSKKPGKPAKQPSPSPPKPLKPNTPPRASRPIQTYAPETPAPQTATRVEETLFGALEMPATGRVVKLNSKVTIKNPNDQEMKCHLVKEKTGNGFTAAFQQITYASPLAQAMIGKKAGEHFNVSGNAYRVVEVR